jgi:hypothetical protein
MNDMMSNLFCIYDAATDHARWCLRPTICHMASQWSLPSVTCAIMRTMMVVLLMMTSSIVMCSYAAVSESSSSSSPILSTNHLNIYISLDGTADVDCGWTISKACNNIANGIRQAESSNHTLYQSFTLLINDGTYDEDNEEPRPIRDMTITFQPLYDGGYGHVIFNMSNSVHQQFEIHSSTITIKDIQFMHAKAGWLTIAAESSLTLMGCRFTDIWQSSSGSGPIEALRSNITLINTTFINCGVDQTTMTGGLIYIYHSTRAPILASYHLLIINSQFIHSTGISSRRTRGGCIWLSSKGVDTHVSIINSLFDSCQSNILKGSSTPAVGGAIALVSISSIPSCSNRRLNTSMVWYGMGPYRIPQPLYQ